ncbi:MAG: metalloprotease PmbA [Neisseriaceae bacterium]|nr:metalloprotease PmbA [Neisseriaceae bacterium]
MFHYTENQLHDLTQSVLDQARAGGATAADVDVSEGHGQSVSVRLQSVDQIEYQQDKGLGVTVYIGQKKGFASTADFSDAAVTATVKAALNIAKYTAEDEFAGLADAALMATHVPDLDLYHPWDVSVEEAITLAQGCEAAAQAFDERVSNSDGAAVNANHYQYVYGNSHGFMAGARTSRHSVSCSVVAKEASGGMQRDYWYDVARSAADLDSIEAIGAKAAQRTVRRLDARKIKTGHYPVVFESTVALSLISHLVGALSGGALYREASFLLDSLGKRVLADWVNIQEQPHEQKGFGSTYFDAEGVATQPRDVVKNGEIMGYFLSSYSGRKLGMPTTANAGGAHSLHLNHTHPDLASLLKEMGTGLLVTELMGQGVNMLTGDYSRGAAGFWVENGMIVHPVEEITIAGQLQEMYANLVGVADDVVRRGAHRVGSMLIDNMTVAAGE